MTAAAAPRASLTVYTDQGTGIRIALALGRVGGSPTRVPWWRLGQGGLDEACTRALAAGRPAFAVVLPGERPDVDPAAALSRCLSRLDLDGLQVGPEMAQVAGRPVPLATGRPATVAAE